MVKGVRGAKVKVIFQILQMALVVLMLLYNLKICILGTLSNIAFYI
jgi:hypothetical protein